MQKIAAPRWIEPQLSKLVDKAPTGDKWVHEVKFDGYRMAARIGRGKVQLLTRTGLDWTTKYPATAAALAKLPVKTAYIDGELCGVRRDGVTSFEIIQQASDSGGGALICYAFDLLELNSVDIAAMALLERKERLATILKNPPAGIAYSEHEGGDGEPFRRAACRHGLEGVVSKRIDRRYLPGDRGVWLKSKCLNRAEFVIVGWSDRKDRATASGRCCSAITNSTADCSTPAASELECPSGRSPCCLSGQSRWRSRRWRSLSRRLARPASAARWRCPRCTGFAPSWSRRLPI
jgi:ATP-dependent DNA ligase